MRSGVEKWKGGGIWVRRRGEGGKLRAEIKWPLKRALNFDGLTVKFIQNAVLYRTFNASHSIDSSENLSGKFMPNNGHKKCFVLDVFLAGF